MIIEIIGPLLTSLLFSAAIIPSIIKIATAKQLVDKPDKKRKLHQQTTPTLGGVAIFAGTVFSFSFWGDFLSVNNDVKFITSGLVVIFFTGIKDDILNLSPLNKLLAQFTCAILITVPGELYLTSLWGMMGITNISPIIGTLLTVLSIVALINAYNLIDGINGLASGLGFIASISFGAWFYLMNSMSLTILCFSIAGSLLGFLFYNFRHGRIFMGDTGSMVIGFLISILSIKFIESNRVPGADSMSLYMRAAPAIAFSIVIVPVYDMLRVFLARIINGKHPLKPDRRHIHHILIDHGYSQQKAAVILYTFNLSMIFIAVALKEMRSAHSILILLAICIAVTNLIQLSNKYKNSTRLDE